MSQNVTLSAVISPRQALAVWGLVNGMSITKAAEKAGVARETVSRWLHRDPVFIAELQNKRAEISVQTRCALESLGQQAIAALREAVQGYNMRGTKFRAACAILKMLGADKAQTLPDTTAEEVYLRLLQREEELGKQQSKFDASETTTQAEADVLAPREPVNQAPESQDVPDIQEPEDSPGEGGDLDTGEAPAIKAPPKQPLPVSEGKPSKSVQDRPIESGVHLANRGTGFFKNVAAYLDTPGSVKARAMNGESNPLDQDPADVANLTELPHPTQRSATPPELAHDR